jgi:hypothetical protein
VYAVEIDPVSAEALGRSVRLNQEVADRVHVVQGDAAVVELPTADVVVAEIIETGLLDEQQVPVLNALRERSVIGPATRVLPHSYETTLQLISTDHRYYGFAIVAPKHEWPFYATGPGWHRTPIRAVSKKVTILTVDFTAAAIDETVTGEITLAVDPDAEINAVRMAGRVGLSPGRTLGPSHAVNGDKVLPIPPVSGAPSVTLTWRYRMGAGLGSLDLECTPVTRSGYPAQRSGWVLRG